MEKEITLNGTSVGTITWDQDTSLFNFTIGGNDELYHLFEITRRKGGLAIMATGAGEEGLELFATLIPISNSRFLDQLTLEIGKLGYDLE